MATKAGIVWELPPIQLIPRVDAYGDRLLDAVKMLADLFAARMEAYAKQNAPWVDRTTAARQGLRGFAVRQAFTVVIYLVHSVEYGIYLELGTTRDLGADGFRQEVMAPRPIIMPTLERFYSEIMRAVRRLVGA